MVHRSPIDHPGVKAVRIVCAVILVLFFVAPVIEGFPHAEMVGGALALGALFFEPLVSAVGATAAEAERKPRKP
jgi:hypothetical protein